ncbi:MAG: isocitrate lyase/phosphoenolpyruvate mutase family protein [Bacteroidota bacterium]
MNFNELHKHNHPLLICNVWDASSAKAAEAAGFQAIGTSSGAIASMLGYEDGEEIDFKEVLYLVERILKSVKLPLSVDLEAGYSRNPAQIADHIEQLSKLGVVGVNLEDSLVNGKRTLLEAKEFASILADVSALLGKNKIYTFINVRTDPFLLGHPEALSESTKRASLYEEAGADGLFVPCIVKETDIRALIGATKLPVNVMCMPGLANFSDLKLWGVKRISMGNFAFNKQSTFLEGLLTQIIGQSSFAPIFEN